MTVPTVNDYLVQARANRAHAEWLLTERPSDPTAMQWAVTAVFYNALHGLTAYLLARGIIVRSHSARDRALTHPANGVPQNIYDAYHNLDDHGRDARYALVAFTHQEVRDLLDQDLASIATFVGM